MKDCVPIPKNVPHRNKRYMEFVRSNPCCLSGHEGNPYHGIDAHHEPQPGFGTMGGKPCDSRCVPIAHLLHVKMEAPGNSRRAVWEEYGVDPEEVVIEMRERWLDTGGKKFWNG